MPNSNLDLPQSFYSVVNISREFQDLVSCQERRQTRGNPVDSTFVSVYSCSLVYFLFEWYIKSKLGSHGNRGAPQETNRSSITVPLDWIAQIKASVGSLHPLQFCELCSLTWASSNLSKHQFQISVVSLKVFETPVRQPAERPAYIFQNVPRGTLDSVDIVIGLQRS